MRNRFRPSDQPAAYGSVQPTDSVPELAALACGLRNSTPTRRRPHRPWIGNLAPRGGLQDRSCRFTPPPILHILDIFPSDQGRFRYQRSRLPLRCKALFRWARKNPHSSPVPSPSPSSSRLKHSPLRVTLAHTQPPNAHDPAHPLNLPSMLSSARAQAGNRSAALGQHVSRRHPPPPRGSGKVGSALRRWST